MAQEQVAALSSIPHTVLTILTTELSGFCKCACICKIASSRPGSSESMCSSCAANSLVSLLHINVSSANTGDNLAKAVPTFDRERLPDAHGLVDIESSFSKLVGNKFEAVLDLKFLKIVMHVVFGKRFGKSACPN